MELSVKDIVRWIILRWILERKNGVVWTGLMWLRIGTSEHCNAPSGPIKYWEVVEQLHNWWLSCMQSVR
jgi:hypothetical protein